MVNYVLSPLVRYYNPGIVSIVTELAGMAGINLNALRNLHVDGKTIPETYTWQLK